MVLFDHIWIEVCGIGSEGVGVRTVLVIVLPSFMQGVLGMYMVTLWVDGCVYVDMCRCECIRVSLIPLSSKASNQGN